MLNLFKRTAMRDFRREAVFLCIIPFCAALSKRLAAWVTAGAASPGSPDAMERSALLTPVRVALRMARLRWARFTDCRKAFLAGKFYLRMNVLVLGLACPYYKPPNALFQRITDDLTGFVVPATDQKRVAVLGAAIGVRGTQPSPGREFVRVSCHTYG